MKKLTLDLDALRLESFEATDETAALQGTVHGAQSTATDGCPASYPFHCGPAPLTYGCA